MMISLSARSSEPSQDLSSGINRGGNYYIKIPTHGSIRTGIQDFFVSQRLVVVVVVALPLTAKNDLVETC